MVEGINGHGEVSGGETVPQRGAKSAFRGLCGGTENRGLAPIGEAPDSVRGLPRV